MLKKTWKDVDWVNASVISVTPVAAITLAILYLYYSGFYWFDLGLFITFYYLTGLGITAGYHRYFSHRTYECHPIVQFFYLIFGAAAVQNSALCWSSDHRVHHMKTDTEEDPYNIKKGFFWAHMGWIYFKGRADPDLKNVKDLTRNKLVMWQHRYYLLIVLVAGFILPGVVSQLITGRFWGGVLWGGLVRLVVVHHKTFFINSAAHVFGKRTYDKFISARDSWWLAFFTFGEGFHNYHHTYPNDYRNGIRWFHFDPTKWLIATLSVFGLTKNLTRVKGY